MGAVEKYLENIKTLLKTKYDAAVILQALCKAWDDSDPAYPLANEIATIPPEKLDLNAIIRQIDISTINYPKDGEFAGLLSTFLICYPHHEAQFTAKVLAKIPPRSETPWLAHQYITLSPSITPESKAKNIELFGNFDFQFMEEKERQNHLQILLQNILDYVKAMKQIEGETFADTFNSIIHILKKVHFYLPLETTLNALKAIVFPLSRNWFSLFILLEFRDTLPLEMRLDIGKAIDKEIATYTHSESVTRLQLIVVFQCAKEYLLKEVPTEDGAALSQFTELPEADDDADELLGCLVQIKTPLSLHYQKQLLKKSANHFLSDFSCHSTLLKIAPVLDPSVTKIFIDSLLTCPINNYPEDENKFVFLMRFIVNANLSPDDRLAVTCALEKFAQQKNYGTRRYSSLFFTFFILSTPFKTDEEKWEEINTLLYNQNTGLASVGVEEKDEVHTLDCMHFLDLLAIQFSPAFQQGKIQALEQLYTQQKKDCVKLAILTLLSHFGLDQLKESLNLADLVLMLEKTTDYYPPDLRAPLLLRLQTHLAADRANDLNQLPLVTCTQSFLYESSSSFSLLSLLPLQQQAAFMKHTSTHPRTCLEVEEELKTDIVKFIVTHSLDQQIYLLNNLSIEKSSLLEIRMHQLFLCEVVRILQGNIPADGTRLIFTYLPFEKTPDQTNFHQMILLYLENHRVLAKKQQPTIQEEKRAGTTAAYSTVDGQLLRPLINHRQTYPNNNRYRQFHCPTDRAHGIDHEFKFSRDDKVGRRWSI